MAFIIQDREAGNRIDEFATLEEAQMELARFEEIDEKEGTYTPDFYEIVEKENTFYFNDKNERIERVKPNNSHTVIVTNKTFNNFVEDYENAREEGNSIIDSIEWAR